MGVLAGAVRAPQESFGLILGQKGAIMASTWQILGLAAICAAAGAGTAAAAPTCNNPEILHLVSLRGGESSAVLEQRGAVSTDRTACYQINIQDGSRTLTVHLFSEDPASFLQLYAPTWNSNRASGAWVFTGPHLPGAGPADHAKVWKGAAPLGNILIVVDMAGTARQYRVRIEAQ